MRVYSVAALAAFCLGVVACGAPRSELGSDASVQVVAQDDALRVTDAELDHALATWRKFGMPEPPAGSSLAIVTSETESWVGNVKQPPDRELIFLVEPARGKIPATVFDGTYARPLINPNVRTLEEGQIDEAWLKGYQWSLDSGVFRYSPSFNLGMCCLARGHYKTGRALVERSIGKNYSTVRDAVRQPECKSLDDTLGAAIWAYWFNEIYYGKTDLAVVHDQLQRAVTTFAVLRPEDEYRKGYYSGLVEQLGSSLAASSAAAGSVESLVDSLVHTQMSLWNSCIRWVPLEENDGPPDNVIQLALLGFDAVRALYEHREDKRLTRSTARPMINGTTSPLTVGDLAGIILEAISGGHVERGWKWEESTRESTWGVHGFEGWWPGAKAKGEKQHLLESAVNSDGMSSIWSNCGADLAPLILGKKYPDALMELFAGIARDSIKADVAAVVEGIVTGTADNQRKVHALLVGVDSTVSYVKESALRGLQRVDDDAFALHLANLLRGASTKIQRPRPYLSDTVGYTRLVPLTANDKAWAALRDLTNRAEPSLRVYLLGQIRYAKANGKSMDKGLEYVAAYTGDTTVVDLREPGAKSSSADQWTSLRVAEVAAMRLGEMLSLGSEPEPGWTESRWARHHEEVASALRERGIPLPKKPD